MNSYKKLKLKLFLFDFIFELIMLTSISLCAWFNDKIEVAIIFLVSWSVFRVSFPEEFHCKGKTPLMSVLKCLFWSNVIFWTCIPASFPITISLFSSIILAMAINYGLYKLYLLTNKKLNISLEREKLYSLSEDELRNFAKSKGLGEQIVDTLVLKVIHNYKWVEIERERNYSKDGIRYHKEKLNKVLGFKL